MFDVRAFPRVGPLTQRLEQGPVIQERGFALISPRCVALLTPGVQPFTFAPGCAELRDFAAKISQTVQNVLESFAVSGNEKGKN